MFKLLECCRCICQRFERTDCKLDCEHDCVDRDTGASHPENKHHHWQLTKRRLCKCPCFVFKNLDLGNIRLLCSSDVDVDNVLFAADCFFEVVFLRLATSDTLFKGELPIRFGHFKINNITFYT